MDLVKFSFLIVLVVGVTHGSILNRELILKQNVLPKLNINKTFDASLRDASIFVATMNDYGDELLANVNALFQQEGLDPYSLDDVEEGYKWGHLDLSKIHIDGLSTMYRSGDNIFTYNQQSKILKMDMTLGFKALKFGCNYNAKLVGFGPSGSLTGEIENIEMLTSILIDFNSYQAVVNDCSVRKSGHISIELHGNPRADQFANTIINATTTIFKRLIYEVVDSVILSILESIVEVIDGLLQLLLG